MHIVPNHSAFFFKAVCHINNIQDAQNMILDIIIF